MQAERGQGRRQEINNVSLIGSSACLVASVFYTSVVLPAHKYTCEQVVSAQLQI